MKKQEKKFVLAGLALLAITGLLALAGCKNDTVPEPTRYTVKFETAHGTAPADITVVSGTKLTDKDLAIEPEVGDNIFEGWYDGETKAEGGTYTVTKDVTLVAKWRERGTVASVTFTPPTDTKFYLGESIEVSLTSEEGATIQYKLGDQNWQDYTADTTISITGDTTITTITARAARAAKEGLKPSAVTSATYTVRKLEGITVTSPERTVYSVGQSFDPTGMVVTATYEGGEKREVTGWETDFSTVADVKGLNKPVTVSYTEGETPKTTTFTITVFPEEVKVLTELEYTSPNNTGSKWTYVAFGEWPQTIKDASVDVDETKSKEMGIFTYYLDRDGNHYVKITAKPYEDTYTYTYSDGNLVEKDKEVYFKVEPIVWRVLTEDYKDPDGKSTGNALLLAESILTGGIKWADSSNNYMQSYIRRWLNGNSGTGETSDYNGDAGFLQTAFTESARKLIADTSVDNSAASTIPSEITAEALKSDWNDGVNPHASDTPTTDKVFLLSEEEATTLNSGFDEYSDFGEGNTRIRVTTDYAKATGAYQGNPSAGYGGWWCLRSPNFISEDIARDIGDDGLANNDYNVNSTNGGVVPALSISLQ